MKPFFQRKVYFIRVIAISPSLLTFSVCDNPVPRVELKAMWMRNRSREACRRIPPGRRPIFVVAPNLVSADRTSRKRTEFAVRSVLRCHQSVRNGPHTRVFRSSVAGLQAEKDSMAERDEFEPSVPTVRSLK